MKTRQLLLIGLIAFCATAVLSQTLPSTPPSKGTGQYVLSNRNGEIWRFQLGGKHYRARITREEVDAGPDWRPSMPVPLSLAKAEELARAELHKLGTDDTGWEVTAFHLKRLQGSAQPKWYYVVAMAPAATNGKAGSDSFLVLITLSGKQGVVKLDDTPK